MTTTTSTTAALAPPGAHGAPTRWQRHRATVLIVGGLLLAVAVVVIFGGGIRTTDPLDPDNPGPGGARAVATVLEDQGVTITVARGAAELDAADPGPGPGTTVLVVNPEDLGEQALADLVSRFAGDDLVIAGAGPGATAALGSSSLPGRVPVDDARSARCENPLVSGLKIQVDGAYAYPSGDGCFPGRYGVLLTPARSGVTLFGADQALTNDQVLRADNAAVALRLLGQDQQLLWYVPSLSDLTGSDGVSLRTLLPRWIQPALGIGVLMVLSLMLWRGRRLGALATEPLPVVVKAIETTHSLGRLYRRSNDRSHAAATLRQAAVRRAGTRLQLGRRAEPDAVVRAVAAHLERSEDDIRTLLDLRSPAPTTDPGLIALANDLAELDREVRRP